MKLTKIDIIVLCLVTFTPVYAFLDWVFIGIVEPMDYLFLCAVEMLLFAGGYCVGRSVGR